MAKKKVAKSARVWTKKESPVSTSLRKARQKVEQDIKSGKLFGKAKPKKARKKKEPNFSTDWRKDNPGLHLHYVKSAVRHLMLLHTLTKVLWDQSNWKTTEIAWAIDKAIKKNISEDAAWYDADEIIKEAIKGIEIVNEQIAHMTSIAQGARS